MLKKAMFQDALEARVVLCRLCAHHCKIPCGKFGICGVRKNDDGVLYTYSYGKIIAANADPVEKKPFYHFLPGTDAYSIAAAGCNFKCSFCQNWTIARAEVKDGRFQGESVSPERVVSLAIKNKCRSVSYTYTEPTIFFEYAYDISILAKESGLKNSFVTNGFMTREAIDKIAPHLDAANVDLKFFNDESYKNICNGRLQPVLESIRRMKDKGIWLEVTTLIIPDKNDSEEELGGIAGFLSETGKDIPWHISRFHPEHKLRETPPTPVETLLRVAEIGKKAGLKYVYLGNVSAPGDTVCPACGTVLVQRSVPAEFSEDFLEDGKCGVCGIDIEGVWK